jgi:hypothetical protein
LSSENSTIISRHQQPDPNLPMIPPMAPAMVLIALATFLLDDPTTLFCWNARMAGVLHCAPMTAKNVPRKRICGFGPGITRARPTIQSVAWKRMSHTLLWNLSARKAPPKSNPSAAI